ncbi:outer membrane protein assembly factor BamB family protein [Pedomonas mirosovicensis]|uniref:outer membrane protein assembly factor BamB family protein n=1 Tax=Pedomonas mirosovicensis TaxID=2908641 RepID=UPI00216A910E|nr:PQQ-binding-like beta-propeller repeat protein [Pedomonas mirosovicensis]MCH8684485.1 PQQ-binding-like beta-propeller repeat protein [Pedomonas mirosovicensis]
MKFRTAVSLLALAALAACSGSNKDKHRLPGERIPVLAFEQQLEADATVADLKVTLPAPYTNKDWAQPGGAPAKAMHHLSLPETLTKDWTVSVGEGGSRTAYLLSPPIVADGKLFTIDTEATIQALDAETGRKLWSFTFPKKESKRLAFGGGVAYDNGKLIATSGYGFVAAIDAGSGEKLWQVDMQAPFRGAPTVVGDRAYVLTFDNQLFALSTENGDVQWDATGIVENASILGTAAPAVSADTLVVGYSSGELTALRVENGRVTWQELLSRTGRTTAIGALLDIDASPVIDRGRVFAIGNGGRMVSLELTTGQRVWEINLGGVHTPWVAGDFIYAVTSEGELVCVTRNEGRIRWLTQLQRYKDVEDKEGLVSWAGPVLAGDRLILTSSNGYVATVSPYTGELISVEKLGEDTYLQPVVAGNRLYIMTNDGRITAFR